MNTRETNKEFDGQLAALEIVAIYLNRAVSLLRRCLEEELHLKDRDNTFVSIVSTHYIVNNLASLFDDRGKEVNSLTKIGKRFEKNFPKDFFVEYIASIEKLHIKYADDIGRIKQNRHLSMAHLGASKKKRLGWNPGTAKRIDQIFGTQSPIAENDSLRFITPQNILKMSIIKDIPTIKIILDELSFKSLSL